MTAQQETPEPTIVRGVDVVVGSDGTAHRVERPAVALCECELSRLAPWCDGTHKLLREKRARARRSTTSATVEKQL